MWFTCLPCCVLSSVAAIVAAKRLIFSTENGIGFLFQSRAFSPSMWNELFTSFKRYIRVVVLVIFFFMCRQFKVLSTQHLKRNKIQRMHPHAQTPFEWWPGKEIVRFCASVLFDSGLLHMCTMHTFPLDSRPISLQSGRFVWTIDILNVR